MKPSRPTVTVIVCAYNEERYLGACLQSLQSQTLLPDQIIVVNNASSDGTGQVAAAVPGVHLLDEPRRGLVVAREAARHAATGELLLWLDADCRAPREWVDRLVRRFEADPRVVAVSGPCRFYDWHPFGRVVLWAYDHTVAPLTHLLVHHALRRGAILYGGNFGVRRETLAAIGGFDTSIEFHGEDTNLARRLRPHGRLVLAHNCYLRTSARRYRAMGMWQVFRLYVRNYWSQIIHARAKDTTHVDVRN
ncbi:MAG: glycosyltransferase [Luteitalea sp.]|nr:glycosyltransferase [Luteitalea sp.]